MLRMAMHITEEQAKREGIKLTFPRPLAVCIVAGNALTSVGQATPYQAVSGRQPPMLPDLEVPSFEPGDSANGRKEARVREIALMSMMQATAMGRTVRALASRSSPSGQDLYCLCAIVDIRTEQ